MAKRYKKENLNALTFNMCSECKNPLTVSEVTHGDKCIKCISNGKEVFKSQAVLDCVAKIETGKDFKLEEKEIHFNGENYHLNVWAGDVFQPEFEILNEQGILIFYSNHIEMPEGLEVMNYLIINKIITIPKDKASHNYYNNLPKMF